MSEVQASCVTEIYLKVLVPELAVALQESSVQKSVRARAFYLPDLRAGFNTGRLYLTYVFNAQ